MLKNLSSPFFVHRRNSTIPPTKPFQNTLELSAVPSSAGDGKELHWYPGATSTIILPKTSLLGPLPPSYTLLPHWGPSAPSVPCRHHPVLHVSSSWLSFPLQPTSSSLQVNYLFATIPPCLWLSLAPSPVCQLLRQSLLNLSGSILLSSTTLSPGLRTPR